jgi:HK97 gp10 family phage protein
MPDTGISIRVLTNRIPEAIGMVRLWQGRETYLAARRIAQRARRGVHVGVGPLPPNDPGHGSLRDSIQVIKQGVGEYAVTAGTPERDYWDAFAEEYGTSQRPPHSFLRPAYYDDAPEMQRRYRRLAEMLMFGKDTG